MTAVLRKTIEKNGSSKDEAQLILQEMTEQLLLIEQKVKVNADREVWLRYQNVIHQIEHTKDAIEKIIR
ncbi:hypothetical protein [Oceanobacillus rekensis]|uniref:hypothetical protein n=1 Tax=Oceanobacillus rekensis TaxID=937927 RepID=UPI000B439DEE|nr:hypothetical protein [Oceanobacillus rekensis]